MFLFLQLKSEINISQSSLNIRYWIYSSVSLVSENPGKNMDQLSQSSAPAQPLLKISESQPNVQIRAFFPSPSTDISLECPRKDSESSCIFDTNILQGMAVQTPLEIDSFGFPMFSHQELVRRNVLKHYVCLLTGGRVFELRAECLESYLRDSDFLKLFEVDKTEFYKLPKWKQVNAKKKLHIFWLLISISRTTLHATQTYKTNTVRTLLWCAQT